MSSALGPVRQDSDDVGMNLSETAFDEKALYVGAALEAEFPEAKASDQGRPAGKDAQLAVVHRQGHEIDRLVENRPLGRDHDALEGLAFGCMGFNSLRRPAAWPARPPPRCRRRT